MVMKKSPEVRKMKSAKVLRFEIGKNGKCNIASLLSKRAASQAAAACLFVTDRFVTTSGTLAGARTLAGAGHYPDDLFSEGIQAISCLRPGKVLLHLHLRF
jgi:hypothetical protein